MIKLVLIESDWNLKYVARIKSVASAKPSINRIRLEFKVHLISDKLSPRPRVLIESDWNLKEPLYEIVTQRAWVLIESDWNLKYLHTLINVSVVAVLIESDWNLKFTSYGVAFFVMSINRIRLEFKDARMLTEKCCYRY